MNSQRGAAEFTGGGLTGRLPNAPGANTGEHGRERLLVRMPVHPRTDGATDLDLAARAAVNVMVTACNRADRETWARTIHDRSARGDRAFVAVSGRAPSAGGRPVRGEDVDDWFVRAAGGTLFIDEVGQLSPSAQTRLFSRLTAQSRHGSGAAISRSDRRVRIVTGSDRPLQADLARGAFSDALFYRLNVVHLDEMHQEGTGEDAMKARDIMSRPPHTCEPNTDLATVAKIMWDRDCGFVPVVDASGTVTGVVTDRDICIATSTRRLLPEHISASQVMTTPIHTCRSDDNIRDVLQTMKQFRVRRVPVIDANGRLEGVISLNDIVLAANDKREPRASDVVATMAAICAHRPIEAAVA